MIDTGAPVIVQNPAENERSAVRALEKRLGSMGMSSHVTSYMIVPLRANERTMGALKFIMSESDRHLTHRDLALAEDLGRRAAIAIDNARLYKDAQTANRMKDEFLTVVSHELRTPLTPILGWTRMLRDDKLSAAERRRALEVIERNASTQAKLVEDLLDVSRIITGKLRLNIQLVDLGALIAACIESLRPAADAKRMTVKLETGSENLMLPGDAERLQQVLWNLLSNAIKFTPDEGTIGVRAIRAGGKIVVEVSDSGRGIDAQFLPFVFDRFRQADSSTTREHGGLGIGLAIVRHLVELHGGSVRAESPGIGKGSTFSVTLPVLERRSSDGSTSNGASDHAAPSEAQSSARIKGRQILIVEDEPDTRDLLTRLFQQRGAIVVAACVGPRSPGAPRRRRLRSDDQRHWHGGPGRLRNDAENPQPYRRTRHDSGHRADRLRERRRRRRRAGRQFVHLHQAGRSGHVDHLSGGIGARVEWKFERGDEWRGRVSAGDYFKIRRGWKAGDFLFGSRRGLHALSKGDNA